MPSGSVPTIGFRPGEVDVVAHDAKLTGGIGLVDGACRVCRDKRAHAQKMHKPNGERDLLRRIPLVSVQAALHGEHRLPAKLAAHKATLVTRRRTALHMGNLAERDDDGILDLLSQRAEARAEHDADRGLAITEALPQDASRFFEVRFEHVISRHVRSSP